MKTVALGIDISKESFDAEVMTKVGRVEREKFDNSMSGFGKLGRWLSKQGIKKVHACMESTSTYHEDLAYYLHEAGHIVSVENPAPIKAFGQSEMLRNKTDAADAGLIRRYCEERSPRAWQPPSAAARELRALSRHLESLSKTRQQECNRLEACKVKSVIKSLNSVISSLDREIEKVEEQIKELTKNDPDLGNKLELLKSIPGVGDKTATTILSEVQDFKIYDNARQLAAHAGLTPRNTQSGKKQHAQLSKIGNSRLRKALYFPAVVAMKKNLIVNRFCENLKARGKHNMEIVCAAMRKLLHIIFGVLKSNRAFDPNMGATS